MTQITRCPSCGTRFKVVADQLRISQGWVRCGICQNVFDASLDLLELPDEVLQIAAARGGIPPDRPHRSAPAPVPADAAEKNAVDESMAPSEAPGTPEPGFGTLADAQAAALPDSAGTAAEESIDAKPVTRAVPVPDTQERQPSGDEPFLESLFEPSFVDQSRPLHGIDGRHVPGEQETARPGSQPPAFPAPPSVQDTPAPEESLSGPSPAWTDGAPQVRHPDHTGQDDDGELGMQAPDEAGTAQAEPGFVRQARRQAFWHSATVRGVLLLGCVAATASLATQMLWQKRDALAVQYPALQPVLRTMCLAAGCRLQARREIGDVVISSSGFRQLPGQRQYLWSLSLENRSEVPVATPVAELTLTDAQDKPLLRRVVELVPLGAPAQLGAREEWSVSVPVQVQELPAPVAGYRALVFYP